MYNLNISATATGQNTATVTFNGFNESGSNVTMTLTGTNVPGGAVTQQLKANSPASKTVYITGLSAGQTCSYTVSANGESFGPVYVTTNPIIYTISYNGNSNTGGSTSSTSGPAPLTISGNGFTKTGYAFTSWNTAADGSGTSYSPGSSYSGSVTLYAQWTPLTPKVWNGTSWTRAISIKVWNGSSWVEGQMKVWNGSSWSTPQ